MLPKDYALNIQRSFNRFLFEKLSADYYINYSASADAELERRIRERVNGYWKWIEIHWLNIGPGIFSISQVQLNCNTIIEEDPLMSELPKIADDIQDELNVDTIPLLDFSDDPEDPIPTDNVLIPRFRGSKVLPNAVGDTVSVQALTYNIYVWRESVLP